ncbi:hypothetical protein [Nocardia terpenica]|uniref:hypothetical protein n=1 Tax=Nocardia terpenica TaxID=455432 RepID=UPI0012FE020D|nr:hypothetical protein [Nocardia terpenica]
MNIAEIVDEIPGRLTYSVCGSTLPALRDRILYLAAQGGAVEENSVADFFPGLC